MSGLPTRQTDLPAEAAVVEVVRRRTARTLVTSQIAGGLGVASGGSVGALMAADVMGREDLAGFVQSSQVLGAALLALPAARLAVAAGRRSGLALGYGLAAVGCVLAVVAAQIQSFPLLLVGTALFGGGTTAGLQARYAATDLAPADRRGRALSVVVWATTVGGVIGPNLVDPAGWFGEQVGIERLAGPFLLSAAMLLVGALVVQVGLRPDPLLLARSLHAQADEGPGRRRGVLRSGLGAVSRSPRALLGLVAVVVAHTVMVSVMVMTPIHMDHGHASLRVIGFVISVHIAGMFAFSPVMGWLSDSIGRIPVVAGGGVALLGSVALSGTSAEGHSVGLTLGLFLLGLGWSACLVAGSTLLTESVPVEDRPAAQGSSDLLMGLAAAGGGGLAGVVVGTLGFGLLNAGAAVLVVALLLATTHPTARAGPRRLR
ncbi:MAG: MFS transporter [Jiangellaceae bacterium]